MICGDTLEYDDDVPIPTREYVLQNWRADVIALADSTGNLLERITYDPYGIPFATHPTDLTHSATPDTVGYGTPDGTINNDDYFYFLVLYGLSDWRADWNRDGVVDTDDHTAYLAEWTAATGSWGRGVLSNRGNILGYAGYVHEPATGAAGGGHGTMWHVRHRVLHSGLGRWIQRDPIEYGIAWGGSLVEYVSTHPINSTDPLGLQPFYPSTLSSSFNPRPFRPLTLHGDRDILSDDRLPWVHMDSWSTQHTSTSRNVWNSRYPVTGWTSRRTNRVDQLMTQSMLKHPSAYTGKALLRIRTMTEFITYNFSGQVQPQFSATILGPTTEIGWNFRAACNTQVQHHPMGGSYFYGKPVMTGSIVAPGGASATGTSGPIDWYFEVLFMPNMNKDDELAIDVMYGFAWWPNGITITGAGFTWGGVGGSLNWTGPSNVRATSGQVGTLYWTCEPAAPSGPGGGS